MNTAELIAKGLSAEVKPEHIEVLKKVLHDNDCKQTYTGALFFLQEEAVQESLEADCIMFWGKVALSLPHN